MQIPHAKFFMGPLQNLNATGCELPYHGGVMSMIILLPQEWLGLEVVEEKLLQFDLGEEWKAANLQPQTISLEVPRFRVESAIDLEQVLAKIGMTDMFDPSAANLFKLTSPIEGNAEEPLYVSVAIQKAFIDVNEASSESAAATLVVVGRGCRQQLIPRKFICNQPFLYFIRHNPSGLVLFSGKVGNPAA